jgi:hypothetical protein
MSRYSSTYPDGKGMNPPASGANPYVELANSSEKGKHSVEVDWLDTAPKSRP